MTHLNVFMKAKSYNFYFHKNDVTWPLSANGLLLVGDKMTACVNEICLLGVVCNGFELENIVWCNILLSWKTFAINFNVLLQVTYCFFTSCWLAHNQLSWNVLLFSCNPIGELYLSGPSYSSQNVRLCG